MYQEVHTLASFNSCRPFLGIFDEKHMLIHGLFGVLRGLKPTPELHKSHADDLGGMQDFVENQGAKPTAVFVASWGHWRA